MTRKAQIKRKTAETDIDLILSVDGSGDAQIQTGIGFFDHMLILLCKHGFMDMTLNCIGDLAVDGHHTVEDIGIVLGKAFKEALGDKSKIARYGTVLTPMDESLALVALDISGRAFLHFDAVLDVPRLGDFDTELVEEFMRAFSTHAEVTLHIQVLYGKNNHHKIEAIFKGLGRALDQATALQNRIDGVLSTKGLL
ncbi:imidazoleglycerol-phosphate dehydratase HisB [Geosporobacter ferrireducens]|uniref:Imidazoleglycerol-phosphate dehydratase n=1 Tax=Geosporobacter ferrireducens TaxID=1424294 RepID=A0A1D8GP53_9FIRM|nr:imidazoleglycerol-phosphate dehydratase HisB [Geosporobacter ferrireducens]AOT72672.1 imidazoleglycerol-phosphate dehydratase [Geosporobacter ferrireducens]MTI55080.1 imidazoleglycerol-phosphate dehydratase HisB [Geosporobacter ferrireducens]